MARRDIRWAIGAAAWGSLAAMPAYAQELPDLANAGSDDHARALLCLTLAIAYEAGFETQAGQEGVAEVILNRARHPAYPKSVCGVVFQGSQRRTGCQFTFTCDGALGRALPKHILDQSRAVAIEVLSGQVQLRVGGATHYHASYVSPYWAPSLIRVGRIGAHIFYRAPGSLDQPARYIGGAEPAIAALGSWLTAPDSVTGGGVVAPRADPAPAPVAVRPAFAPWGLIVR